MRLADSTGTARSGLLWFQVSDSTTPPVLGAVAQPATVLAHFDNVSASVTPTEFARASLLRSTKHQEAFLAAHLLVRLVAAQRFGTSVADLAVEQACGQCGAAGHGRPTLQSTSPLDPDWTVSFSHAADYVAAVAATGPVGVDIEDGACRVPLIQSVLSAGEREGLVAAEDPDFSALELWTRKEAMVKLGVLELDGFGSIDARGDTATVVGGPAVSLLSLRTKDWVVSVARLAGVGKQPLTLICPENHTLPATEI